MRGAERIIEHPPAGKDWQGDPIDVEPDPREILDCQLWPITEVDQDTKILDGKNVFVPPDQVYPSPLSEISLPESSEPNVRWYIDGNVGPYDMRSVDKGAIFQIKRVL